VLRGTYRQSQGKFTVHEAYVLITFSVRPEVGWLVAGIPPRKPGFITRPVCVVFVVDNVTLEKVSLHNFSWSFYQCSTLILFITDSIFVSPIVSGPPRYRGFTMTLRHTTLSRTLLDEWSTRRKDLYLTTHNTYKTQTSMPPAVFEPTVRTNERRKTDAFDRAATGVTDVYNRSSW